jgi:hypothetical protein
MVYENNINFFFLLLSKNVSAKFLFEISAPYKKDTGFKAYTFNVQNTKNYPIIFDEITVRYFKSTSINNTISIWAKKDSILGTPGKIDSANGWIKVAKKTFLTDTFGIRRFSEIHYSIPANTTISLCISTDSSLLACTLLNGKSSLSNNGVFINIGDSVISFIFIN